MDFDERFYGRLPEVFREHDAKQDEVLRKFFRAVLSSVNDMQRTTDELARADSLLVDAETMPAVWLQWRAQLAGVRGFSALPGESQRTYLEALGGTTPKGTLRGFAEALRPFLTGSKYVAVMPRTSDLAAPGGATMWDIVVVTKTSETISNNVPAVYSQMLVPSIWEEVVTDGPVVESTDPRLMGLSARADASGVIEIRMRRLTNRKVSVTAGDPYVAFFSAVVDSGDLPASTQFKVASYDGDDTVGSTAVITSTGTWEEGQVEQQVAGFTPAATVDNVTVALRLEGLTPGSLVHFGRFGVRLGDDPTWVPETVNVPEILETMGMKPAGVVVHHKTYEASWDIIETQAPTWDAWETLTWDELEGLD